MAGKNLRHVKSKLRENGTNMTESVPDVMWAGRSRHATTRPHSVPGAWTADIGPHGFGPQLPAARTY